MLEDVSGKSFVGHSGGGVSIGIGSAVRLEMRQGWSIAILGNLDVTYADALMRDLEAMVPQPQ